MASKTSSKQRIVFTGGSGVVGRSVVSKLLEHGHEILNVDMTPLNNHNVHTLKADITDGAQAFNSLSCHFRMSEPFFEKMQIPDAVIHFAGIAQPLRHTDNEIFRINTLGSYNIIEAACKLGVKKIILASSISVYGITWADGDVDYPSFPITEETPAYPMDVYATSKVCMERIASAFARRFPGVDIYCLRIGAVIEPDKFEEKFRAYVEQPERWKAHGWSYVDARDLGNICNSALNKTGLGFQIFNAVNNDITNNEGDSTEEFLKKVCPGTLFTRVMGVREAPFSNKKAVEVLGFEEEFPWRAAYGLVT